MPPGAGYDQGSAIDVESEVVDAEHAHPPSMPVRVLNDLQKSITGDRWSVPVNEHEGLVRTHARVHGLARFLTETG